MTFESTLETHYAEKAPTNAVIPENLLFYLLERDVSVPLLVNLNHKKFLIMT